MGQIMLVDDDKMGRYHTRAQLESAGHSVVEAREGLDCLRKLRHEKVDIVVTDLLMPVMDGLELINEIRREYPSMPVIAYTARLDPGMNHLAAAQHIGAVAVFQKPFAAADLLQAVSRALQP